MFLPLLLQGKDQEAVIQDSPVHMISCGIERTSDRPVNNAGQKQVQILNNFVKSFLLLVASYPSPWKPTEFQVSMHK